MVSWEASKTATLVQDDSSARGDVAGMKTHNRWTAHAVTLVALAATTAAACGGSSKTTGSNGNPVSPLAGTYQTAVTLASNSCSGITVQNNPTTVAHAVGATTFTMSHANQSYSGTLGANNAFTTSPNAIPVGATTHTLTIAGQFTTNAFTADVTANVTGGGAACQYVVHWIGTK